MYRIASLFFIFFSLGLLSLIVGNLTYENNEKTVILPKVWYNDTLHQNCYEKDPLSMPNWINL